MTFQTGSALAQGRAGLMGVSVSRGGLLNLLVRGAAHRREFRCRFLGILAAEEKIDIGVLAG